MSPDAIATGLASLATVEPAFATIEPQAGPMVWRVRPPGFAGLLQTIMGQQISSQAAAAIWRRLAALPGALLPAGFLMLDDAALRAAGLSRPKVAHARAVAAAFADGRLDAVRLASMTDAHAIATLTAVPGLGPWTAEVYLVFALDRQDVFPAGDLALAAAWAELAGLPARPSIVAMRIAAGAWAPHRSLAARLLWHYWRFRTGRPSFDDVV